MLLVLTWRQAGAASGELEESFALSAIKVDQNVDKFLEGGWLSSVTKFGLSVPDDIIPGEDWTLITTPVSKVRPI